MTFLLRGASGAKHNQQGIGWRPMNEMAKQNTHKLVLVHIVSSARVCTVVSNVEVNSRAFGRKLAQYYRRRSWVQFDVVFRAKSCERYLRAAHNKGMSPKDMDIGFLQFDLRRNSSVSLLLSPLVGRCVSRPDDCSTSVVEFVFFAWYQFRLSIVRDLRYGVCVRISDRKTSRIAP